MTLGDLLSATTVEGPVVISVWEDGNEVVRAHFLSNDGCGLWLSRYDKDPDSGFTVEEFVDYEIKYIFANDCEGLVIEIEAPEER